MTEKEGPSTTRNLVGRRTWRSWALLVLAGGVLVALAGACTAESTSMQGGHMNGGVTPNMGDSGAMMADIARPATADAADRVVRVAALDQLAFDPPVINVAVDETVAFEVTNPGTTAHEFMLGPKAMQAYHGDQMAQTPGQMMSDSPHVLSLEPGETETIAMRFVGEGELEYGCHVPGHYEGGMVGTVTAREMR